MLTKATQFIHKLQESGGMQTLRQSLSRPCKQEEGQMFPMHIPLMDFQGPCTTVLPKVSNLHTYITAFYTIYSLNDRGLVKQTVRTHKVTFHYLARKILNKTYSEISLVLSQCLQWISKIFDICCMGLWQMHSS